MLVGSPTGLRSAQWPGSANHSHKGYTRNRKLFYTEEFRFRNDVGATNGITTTVEADTDDDRITGGSYGTRTMFSSGSRIRLKDSKNDWATATTGASEADGEEFWSNTKSRMGSPWEIRKTIVVHTQVETLPE